ncbi:MAG: fumarylacetoacetase [Acidimicrobiales bacterium]
MQKASWVPGADGGPFPVEHLPYGVVDTGLGPPRCVAAIGDHAVDLALVAGRGLLGVDASVFEEATLNRFLAEGPDVWAEVRTRLSDVLTGVGYREEIQDCFLERSRVSNRLPVAVADYVDFYSSLEHATNLGRLFRPDADPLLPNWRHLPVGYHGRAGTVVVSGTEIRRPLGQRRHADGGVVFGPSERLDIELEVGFVVGVGSSLGAPVRADDARRHVFGVVLVNDWSARDIQAWEYQPLGPFLGKSFATSISAWITPLAALEHCWVEGPVQEPAPLPHLQVTEPAALAIDLSVELNGSIVGRTGFAGLYWRMGQQLAHLTSNGASLRTGDLFASGTVSGSTPGSEGSLIELTNNTEFLADGDEVVLRGRVVAGGVTFDLGECRGRVLPALH